MSHEEARGIQQLKPISEIFCRSSKRCSIKNANFKNFTKFTCVRVTFLTKLQTSSLQLYLTRDFCTGVFM